LNAEFIEKRFDDRSPAGSGIEHDDPVTRREQQIRGRSGSSQSSCQVRRQDHDTTIRHDFATDDDIFEIGVRPEIFHRWNDGRDTQAFPPSDSARTE
jgi:hypothetical protein